MAMDRRAARASIALPLWARALYGICHPLAIIPVAVVIGATFGTYTPQQITELQEVPLFLQGSTDWGGSNLFAAALALYVTFGILGAWYLVLLSARAPYQMSYRRHLSLAVVSLQAHILPLVLSGFALSRLDSGITPNDFRNTFVFAAVIFRIEIPWVVWIARRRLSLPVKLLLAPLPIYVWLWIGADGTTLKAGQVLLEGQDPVDQPRSARHGVMIRWHRLCDALLGDITRHR